jgi:hypothetical protein
MGQWLLNIRLIATVLLQWQRYTMYFTNYHYRTAVLTYFVYVLLVCRGGQANFFLKSANRKPANSWAHSAIAIRKFLRCASLQIANPQIFMIYLQVANLQIPTICHICEEN